MNVSKSITIIVLNLYKDGYVLRQVKQFIIQYCSISAKFNIADIECQWIILVVLMLSIDNMYVDDVKKYEKAREIEETLFSLKFDASQE